MWIWKLKLIELKMKWNELYLNINERIVSFMSMIIQWKWITLLHDVWKCEWIENVNDVKLNWIKLNMKQYVYQYDNTIK